MGLSPSRSKTLKRNLSLLVALAFISMLAVNSRPSSAASPVTFTDVSPGLIAAGPDYSTDVRGHTWDFSDSSHYAVELSRGGFVGGGTLSGGWFVGTTTSGDSKMFLQDMNLPGTVPTQNEAAAAPINTSYYRYLNFRVCNDRATGMMVYWHRANGYALDSFGGTPYKQFAAGCHAVSFDLVTERSVGAGPLAWNAGSVESLAIKPSGESGVTIKFDYVTLSAVPSGPAVTASWAGGSGTFDLYYDTDPDGTNPTLIKTGVSADDNQFRWTTPNLAPGVYYLIAKNSLGQGTSQAFRVNAPPQATIVAPSFVSGADYATTVAGNPWDMSDAADIAQIFNVRDHGFANGVFSGTNTDGDSGVVLAVPRAIDPSRYYYLTYRMKVDGDQDIGEGSVARVFFWTGAEGTIPTTTQDIVIYDGFRTVTIDLRTVLLEEPVDDRWAGYSKSYLRLDPHEFIGPRQFHIDDVKLTSNDRGTGSYVIRYATSDADGTSVRVSAFYDTNRSGADGTSIACAGGTSDAPGAASCQWDVAGVTDGTYFIYLVLDDGANSTVVYSEAPVEVGEPQPGPQASLSIPPATNTRTITVTASGSAGTTGYYISDSTVTPSASDFGWTSTAPKSFYLTGGDGAKTVYLWTKDGNGAVSAPASDTTNVDTGAPAATIRLRPITRSRTIPVTAAGSDRQAVTGFYISEAPTTPALGAPGWTPVVPAVFELSDGDGTKTLYLWTKDAAGNISRRGSDTIVLDTTQPVASISAPSTTSTRLLPVKTSGTDANGVKKYFLGERSAMPAEGDRGWRGTAPSSFWLSPGQGTKTVYLWVMDAAGNVSRVRAASTFVDTRVPTVSFDMPAFATTSTIDVTIEASDRSGIAGYYLGESSTKPAANAAGWSSTRPGTFELSAGDGTKKVYLFVKDKIGNVTPGSAQIVTLDTHAPRPGIDLGGASSMRLLKTVAGTLTDAQPSSGFETLGRFAIGRKNGSACYWWDRNQNKSVKGSCAEPLWFAVAAKERWSAPVGNLDDPGEYTLYVRFADRAGNVLRESVVGVTVARFEIR